MQANTCHSRATGYCVPWDIADTEGSDLATGFPCHDEQVPKIKNAGENISRFWGDMGRSLERLPTSSSALDPQF